MKNTSKLPNQANASQAHKSISIFSKIVIALMCVGSLMLSSCVKNPDFAKVHFGRYYYRELRFQFDGVPVKIPLKFSDTIYEAYNSQSKTMPYENYLYEDPRYPVIGYIADEVKKAAAPFKLDSVDMAGFVLASVQAVEYDFDPGLGLHPYNRFPVVTLVDGRADCVDKSLLASAILKHMGYPTALILIPDSHHLAVGVQIDDDYHMRYITRIGHHFAFGEPTGRGWPLTVNTCPYAEVKVYDVDGDFWEDRPPMCELHSPIQLAEVTVTPKNKTPVARRRRNPTAFDYLDELLNSIGQ
ncbi:MAG: hypothetical protein JST76_02690 [Bacteroidetes bacterium]|nr:hypothetical protein [Bacteroidota bacterium]